MIADHNSENWLSAFEATEVFVSLNVMQSFFVLVICNVKPLAYPLRHSFQNILT